MMDKKLILEFDKKQKALKHKRSARRDNHEGHSSTSASHKPKHPKLTKDDNGDDDIYKPSSSYRDRAKERREGINKDFELDPDDLKISNPVVGGHLADDEDADDTDEVEKRRQQIEDSKYLGGDIEHTHLVKGLDFALLEKVKSDQKLADTLSGHDRANRDNDDLLFGDHSDSDEEQFTKEALLAASATAGSKQLLDINKLRGGRSSQTVQCRTALARRILNVLDERWPDKSELFLPGRMSYVIPIDEDAEDQSVTTYLLSKEDTSMQDDTEVLNESDLALEQLINILAKIRKGKGSATSRSANQRMRDLDKDPDLNDYNY